MLLRWMIKLFMRHVGLAFDKDSPWQPEKQNQSESDTALEEQPGIFCAHCQSWLASHTESIEMSGAHRHHFTNPAGLSFEIALYRQAACQQYGGKSIEHTWFPGYHWQVAICAQCHQHLGWLFQRAHSPAFYGLITDRIVEK